jgi:FtsP/CotA-like multicopper oxidase with cupredoxin domain
MGKLTRRRFAQLSGLAAASLATGEMSRAALTPDFTLEIAPYLLEASPKHRFQTVAYNGQVPGPLLKMREGRAVSVIVRNLSRDPEVVHWHGLFLPPEVDGAMEEGTPMIAPGATTHLQFTPEPAGFRWFHTHTFAGSDLRKAQYGGLHGFLMIEPRENPAPYDREFFLALHDWGGSMTGGDDGSMNPVYDVSTINGKMMGSGEPLRVKQGEQVMLHVLNSSPTEVHWIALAGHRFKVMALDGNEVAQPQVVEMLRLAPAERVSAMVTMDAPGVWVLGEVRKHVQAAGMAMVVEYAGAKGTPKWVQPPALHWSYEPFANAAPQGQSEATRIELTFDSKFKGHGSQERWMINGKSYPETDEPLLVAGRRYRLVMKNLSLDEHPIHLHRHSFEVKRVGGSAELDGLRKDVVLVPAQSTAEVEFTADHPGRTLLHCHQQNHMDLGFMMVFRYA